jgi:protein ImuA
MGVLIHVARGVVEASPEDEPRAALWIGRRCWPHPIALGQRSRRLLERSVFVEAQGLEERAWAMDSALRCPGVAVVVGDAEGLDISASRRLQLAAEAGASVGLLARPWWERRVLSVARTRWRVATLPGEGDRAWTVELLRCKGLRPTSEDARRWGVRWNHATGDVRVAPDVPDRATAAPARRAV